MANVDTALSPREVLNRLYLRLRGAYSKILSAQPGDPRADASIAREIEAMDILIQKLNMSFIKKLRDDANIDSNSFEKLREIEKVLNEISVGKGTAIRQDHYIHKVAKHIRNVVRGKVKKTKRSGMRELVKVRNEKKKLVRKEVEAKEKMGKR